MQFINEYLDGVQKIVEQINREDIEKKVHELLDLKKRNGRLFILGVGGSAANSAHAVNDFRKIANIETYAPTDNVAELTARTNDDGWDTVFSNWLKGSRLNSNDAVMVLSVGGGDLEKNVSVNIIEALKHAQEVDARVMGIVSRDGGYTKQVAHAYVHVPVVAEHLITPFAESFQAVLWHLFVFHPLLKEAPVQIKTHIEETQSTL